MQQMMVPAEEIGVILNKLIAENRLSAEAVACTAAIKKEWLTAFLAGKKVKPIPVKKVTHLVAMAELLTTGMDFISADERLAAFINVLLIKYQMTYANISAYTELSEEEIKEFVADYSSLSDEKKYQLAIKVFSIYHVLKNLSD